MAEMTTIRFLDDLDGWRSVEAIETRAARPVVAWVGIEDEQGPLLRIDIDDDAGHSCFQDARIACGTAYIGYGEHLFVLKLASRALASYKLDGYFGHVYDPDELESSASAPWLAMLATSASEMLAFSRSGELVWQQRRLGIDGVIAHDAADGVLHGSGEWDPPGGWRDFTLSLATGEPVPSAR